MTHIDVKFIFYNNVLLLVFCTNFTLYQHNFLTHFPNSHPYGLCLHLPSLLSFHSDLKPPKPNSVRDINVNC